MELKKKLLNIQQKLKAPKSQYNSFGKYYYRNCEDIMEAVKPLLDGATLTISDELVMVGNRYYIKATVRFFLEGATYIQVSAFARESETKKGMDESQVTGAASSYARKIALNGLFLIDDTKDQDTLNKHDEKKKVVEDVPDFTPDVTPVRYEEPPMPEPQYEVEVEQPPENTDNGVHMIKVVSVKVKKEGTSKKGPWQLFEIVSATGKKYSTFSNSISSRLREGIEDGSLVPMKVKGEKYGVYEIEKLIGANE